MNYKVLISLGSNLGDRKLAIEQAITQIHEALGTVLAISPLYETPSWGYEDAPYLNNVICLTTDCAPLVLMEALLDIEKQLGRMRTDSPDYQARQIDIDIALIEGHVIDHPSLQVPHPRMHLRKFVLCPAADIAPTWVHETLSVSISDLLTNCSDKSDLKIYDPNTLNLKP